MRSAGELPSDKHGDHYIFDWKCSKHTLQPWVKAFNNECGSHTITKHIPNTHYHKYSLQLSLYAEMLKSSQQIDVGDRLYLVRFHTSVDTFELVKCTNYRKEASMILDMVYTQLCNPLPTG